MTRLEFRVHGTPAPQGSKKHVGRGILIESSKAVKPWREAVKHAALDARAQTPFACDTGSVGVIVEFFFARPKGHYRTGRNAHLLREQAPTAPATKPDVDKLIRSTFDALGEAGVWRDDAQVVTVTAHKSYCPPGEAPGALVVIYADAVAGAA